LSQNYKYTAEDFERYHSGKMSESEMHALEKAALEDPFLADALEGYAFTPTPLKDINDLNEKLFSKKKKRSMLFFLQENVWLRIAAVFILIAGIGYLVYTLNTKKESNLLSKIDSVENKKTEAEQNAPSQMDSTTINNKEDNSIAENGKGRKTLSTSITKIPAQEYKISSEKAVSDLRQNATASSLQKSIAAEYKKDRNALQVQLLKGKVVDDKGYPVYSASIMDKSRGTSTTTDSSERFNLQVADSLSTAKVSAVGYKSKEVMLRDKNDQVVVLEPANQSLNEVVVTAMGVKKQKRQISSATPKPEGKVAGVPVTNTDSEPVNGWQKFNQYLHDNITVPENDAGESYKGKVALSFEINKKGKPKNIKVEQSLCAPCDEEAIRLLRHGPKWKYVNTKRQSVIIQFGN
jgi:hypothetical protein